jgi:hypothetical protein
LRGEKGQRWRARALAVSVHDEDEPEIEGESAAVVAIQIPVVSPNELLPPARSWNPYPISCSEHDEARGIYGGGACPWVGR